MCHRSVLRTFREVHITRRRFRRGHVLSVLPFVLLGLSGPESSTTQWPRGAVRVAHVRSAAPQSVNSVRLWSAAVAELPASVTSTTVPTTVPPPPPPPPGRTARVGAAAGAPGETGPGWEAERGRQALTLLQYPWQKLDYTIKFEPARSGYLALTHRDERLIEVFVRRDETASVIARIVAHELGHAVDLTYNTEDDRSRYKSIRGIGASEPWFGCDSCTDFRTPAGDFAEVFAWHLVRPPDFRSRMAPPPSDEQLRELEPFFRD